MRSILTIFEAHCVSPDHVGYTNSSAIFAQFFKIAWHRVDTLFPGHEKTISTSIEWKMKKEIWRILTNKEIYASVKNLL